MLKSIISDQAAWIRTRTQRALARQAARMWRNRARGSGTDPGVTIMTATWNSLPFLQSMLAGIAKYTPEPVPEVLVVDNHSSDGTQAWLRSIPGVRTLELPVNVGHGPALDFGMLACRTEEVVLLDVDAFPISHDWLDVVLRPLLDGAVVSGAYHQRCFIHPSFLAIRRRDFLELGLSFAPVGRSLGNHEATSRRAPWWRTGRKFPTPLFMDVGEALSHTVAATRGSGLLHRLPPTSVRGPGCIGTVYADVVYHNFFSTQGPTDLVAAGRSAWEEAIVEYGINNSLSVWPR